MKTTFLETVSKAVFVKNKEHYLRSEDKAEEHIQFKSQKTKKMTIYYQLCQT